MTNTTIERLIEIENEREQTIMDKDFQKWFAEMNVSQSYVDPIGFIKAKEIMNMWTNKHGERNSFNILVNQTLNFQRFSNGSPVRLTAAPLLSLLYNKKIKKDDDFNIMVFGYVRFIK